jgi:hypothetical protein
MSYFGWKEFTTALTLVISSGLLLIACDNSTVVDTSTNPKATTQQPGGGPGGPQKTFRIANLRQLERLANKNPGADFVQIKDLKGKQIAPIGSAKSPFTGSYDGNGYEISGLTIKRSGKSGVGLFAATGGGAELKNISLKNADVRGQSQVGVLVGVNNGEVKNSNATGVVTANGSGDAIGGLTGENTGTITGSSSGVTVNGDKSNSSDVGGLAGINRSSGEIINSSATGNVQGDIEIGGLVGSNFGVVRKSSATGNAESNRFTVGGLVGANVGGTVTESYAEGDATSNSRGTAGGFVGINTKLPTTAGGTISDSYATGTATGANQPNGAFVGSNPAGTIERSFTVGDAQGGIAGGFAGKNEDTITGSYWDTDVSSQTDGVGLNQGTATVTGLSTSQMQGASASNNMSALGFQNVWKTVSGDYPALQWEN